MTDFVRGEAGAGQGSLAETTLGLVREDRDLYHQIDRIEEMQRVLGAEKGRIALKLASEERIQANTALVTGTEVDKEKIDRLSRIASEHAMATNEIIQSI